MTEYFMQNLWQAWALVSLLCLILELTNGDFFIICFSIGGICAAMAAAVGLSGWMQILVFAVFTLVSLVVVRPLAKEYFSRGEDKRVSNAEALIGRKGRVSEAIAEGGFGRVAIDGDDWKACSADGSAIVKDTKVRVVGMDSIILTVQSL